jgi:hypothetical protein
LGSGSLKTVWGKNSFRLLVGILLILIIGVVAYSLFIEEESRFEDLPANHEAYETMMWAVDKGIITGYPDGTILPEKQVTESELLAMLFRAFEDKSVVEDETVKGEGNNVEEDALVTEADVPAGDWAVKYYHKAEELNWNVMGRGSRNQTIFRVDLARIASSGLGYNLSIDGAIQTLLNEGVIEGRKGTSLDGFSNGELTRADALRVIKNMADQGVTELRARPTSTSPEPKLETTFVKKMEPILDLGEKLGYTTRMVAWSREVGFSKDGQGMALLIFRGARSSHNQLVLYEADVEESRELASQIMSQLGINVEAQLAKAIENVIVERKPSENKYGTWTLTLNSGNLKDYVQINFSKQ